MASATLAAIQQHVWDARLPLEIRLAPSECRIYDKADPYLTIWPRISYIPLLLSKLHAFFAPYLIADPDSVRPDAGYFTYEGVPLKWHLPLGLLYDLYVLAVRESVAAQHAASPVPFRLVLHYNQDTDNPATQLISADLVTMHDFFINAVKEADFLRSGTAKPIMSLSALDSKALWSSTQDNNLAVFAKIHQSLLPPTNQLRSIPLRIYLPSSPESEDSPAQMKVLQAQVSPTIPLQAGGTAAQARAVGGQPQTLGTALHTLIPSLFPSRRTPIIAKALLHGSPISLAANLDELTRWACYADGWLHVVIAINA